MYGPDYEKGACPGCTNLADELGGSQIHLNHRDVTLLCFSRAPTTAPRLQAADGLAVSLRLDLRDGLPFDFGLALTPEQAREIPEVKG